MINVLHLYWIIPLTALFSMIIIAFILGSSVTEHEMKAYQEGILEGQRMHKEKIQLPLAYTLEELFDRGFNSDFNTFLKATGGIIYGAEKSGQLSMIFIDDVDTLCIYYDRELLSIRDDGQYQRPIIKEKIV